MKDKLLDYARRGQTLDIPVFDIHSHVGKWSTYDMVSLEEQVGEMDRLGIRMAAVSSMAALVGNISRGNAEVAGIVRRYPKRFIGYIHVSANYSDDMLPELERCYETACFRGIKVYQVGVNYNDPLFEPVWTFAEKHRLPILAHTWGGAGGLEGPAMRHPDLAFLMAHSGTEGKYTPYLDAIKAAPNLYIDLTYSREYVNIIRHFVEVAGADRIVWGADAPLFSMAQQLCKVLFANISDEDKEKILYRNAAKLFPSC